MRKLFFPITDLILEEIFYSNGGETLERTGYPERSHIPGNIQGEV